MVEDPFLLYLLLMWAEDLVPVMLLALGQGVPGIVVSALGLFGYVVVL